MIHSYYIYILFYLFISSLVNAKDYNRLFDDLMGKYNRLVRPVSYSNETINIEFKLKLCQLVDVHEKDQVITINGWLQHHWFDTRLSWDRSSYAGLELLHIPGEMIWLPDVILYNNAHGTPSVITITKAQIRYDGRVFGSWTYSGSQLSLIHLQSDKVQEVKSEGESEWIVQRGIDLSEYQESVEWDLMSVVGTRHEKWYPCCDYPSIDITYTLNIRRKKLFYTINLVLPCASLAVLTSWVFYLPCESHQKIQLCVCILVAITVFFLLLMDIIPPTSIVIPLIVKYLVFTFIMVSVSVISTVFMQNVHFRSSDHNMPTWMRRLLIEGIGRKLLISRKTQKGSFHTKARHNKINALSAMSILERQFQKTVFDIEMASKESQNHTPVALNSLFLQLPMMNRSKSVKATPAASLISPTRSPRVRRQMSTDHVSGIVEPPSEAPSTQLPRIRDQLRRAEKNVNYIAKTLTERRQDQEKEADWQFVSLVMDRILLIIFSAIITIGSATLFSAPSMRDTRKPLDTFHYIA